MKDTLTKDAAPPSIIDFTKMPRSPWAAEFWKEGNWGEKKTPRSDMSHVTEQLLLLCITSGRSDIRKTLLTISSQTRFFFVHEHFSYLTSSKPDIRKTLLTISSQTRIFFWLFVHEHFSYLTILKLDSCSFYYNLWNASSHHGLHVPQEAHALSFPHNC
jgi:hypothetical protein